MTRIRNVSLAAAVLSAAATPAAAAVFTWSGLGFQWSNAGSWQGGAAPTSNVNTAIVLTGTGNTTNGFMDLGLTLNSLTYTSEAGPFAFEGLLGFSQFLNFANGGGGAPRLDQFSASNHTIILPDGIGVGPNLTLGGTGTGSLTLDAPLAGPGRLILNGPYTVITTTATSFSNHGGTTLNAGTYRIEHEGALGSGVPIFGGGTLQIAAGGVNMNKSITVNAGGGTIDANGLAFSITNGAQNVTGAGRLTLTSSAAAPGTSTIAARMQQTGGLLVTGAGHVATLTNTVANTYTGGTTVTGGATVSIDSDRLGNAAGGITLDNGTMRLNPASAFTISRTIALGAGGGTFNTTTAGPVGLNGVISGGGGLTKIGVGGIRLLAGNTYSGPTTVSAGSLEIAHDQAAQNSTVNLNGGTLAFSTATPTLGGLTGSGNLALGGLTSLYVGNNNASTTYAGNLTGAPSGGVGKMGTGTWTLTGANTFSGQFAAQGGTTVAGSAGAISPNASITVSPGATLDLNGFNHNMSHANGIQVFSGSTLRLNGGNLTIAAGSSGNFYGSVPMQFGTLTTAAGAVTAYSGASLSNGFIAGPGTQFVTGPNTFNNVTVVNGAALAQSAGSVLNLNNATLGGALTIGGTVNFSNGSVASSGAVGVNFLLNTSGFTNNGTITVNNGGTLSNTVSKLVTGGGSIVNVSAGGTIQLNGLAFDLRGALASNNGTIAGGTTNVYFGSLLAGTGSFGAVVLHPGGAFTPGVSLSNMPAPAPVGHATIVPLDPDQSTDAPVHFSAHTTVRVTASDHVLTFTAPLAGPGKTLTKTDAGTVAVAGLRAGGLHVAGGAVSVLPNGGPGGVLQVAALAIDGGAALRMNDNDLIVDYTGGSVEGQVRQWVKDGRASGSTSGIFTTPGSPDDDKVLAVADNAFWGKSSFNGIDIDGSTVVGKYTFFGDANLDGKVTGDDYVSVDANLGSGDSWLEGDFNMNGVTTGDDYVAIDANLGKGTPNPLAFAELKEEMVAAHVALFGDEYLDKLARAEAEGFGASVVPEPSSVAAAFALIGGLLVRRRRAV
jgi:autotransporter-associated beta strand protein